MKCCMKLAYYCLLAMLILLQTPAQADDKDNAGADVGHDRVLRVCADPNNLPFSNRAGQGFENRLAKLLGQALNERVEYTWWAQRRGFLRATLNAGRCDVVMGLPSQDSMALTTAPYYRSSYVLVYRTDRHYGINSLDDLKLKHLRIGVHLIGNNSPPPAIALAHRGIIDNVVGYNIYGDYRKANPPLRLIKAVVQGDIDVAIVWGPMAGYFAKHEPVALTIAPLVNLTQDGLPFAFSIGLGVRKGDEVMKARLNAALARKHDAIRALLDTYNVPQVDVIQQPAPLAFRDQPATGE